MTLGNLVEIRSLCAKALIKDIAGADITATVYTDAQARGDSRVLLETGVIWDPLNALYPSAQEAAEYFAAYYVLKRYPSKDKNAQTAMLEYYQVAMDICASLVNSSTEGLVIRAKPYKSYPLNPNASYYRSLPAGTADVDDTTLAG
jgi:hypothetical protein